MATVYFQCFYDTHACIDKLADDDVVQSGSKIRHRAVRKFELRSKRLSVTNISNFLFLSSVTAAAIHRQ